MTINDESTNNSEEYTDFRSEELHLADVVGTIDSTIEHLEGRGPVYAGDNKAADIVQNLLNTSLDKMQTIRDRPYFGRIVYSTGEEEDDKTTYIGDVNVRHEDPRYDIASRNAPIASLYYMPTVRSYETPGGSKDAKVYLKRTLTIEGAQLLDIDDALRLPSGSVGSVSTSSRMLDAHLSGSGGEQLTDAVQTIQPEQYEQIASTIEPVLIVQGAAGSGKSLVGLHRIDFILSPFSNIGRTDRPTADRVIMFGPSPAFLKYVSGLLPSLGVHRVRQTTVSSWMLDQFSARTTLKSGEGIFGDLMNNQNRLTDERIQAHLFKTSLGMKRLIDSYVGYLGRKIRNAVGEVVNIRIAGKSPLDIGNDDLRRRVADTFRRHPEPNVARDQFIYDLTEEWLRLQPQSLTPRNESRSAAKRQVERFMAFWPKLDFRTEYKTLVSSPEVLMAHSRKGDLDSDGATEVARTAPEGAGWALEVTDLAGALYLDYSLNGFERERFEHVVVDEAQDVSPLEILLMQMHSVNNSFTILGDLRQSILPYKSISNWNQLATLFGRGSVSRLETRTAYRSTRQITQYSKRILQDLPGSTKMPTEYNRRGERPRLVRSGGAEAMRTSIAESIRRFQHLDNVRSIAVLTKWALTANRIYDSLESIGIEGVRVLTPGGTVETDVTVTPILLTKGLEFDAVIVANAGKRDFSGSDFDRLLLYLACTRARHLLEIHWHDTRSPIVPDVARLAV